MIVLLTYDAPHRKTQDVAWRLYVADIPFKAVAVPWEVRPKRRMIYAHRPAEDRWPCEPLMDPQEYFHALRAEYLVSYKSQLPETLNELQPELVVVGGAGILPPEIVNGFRVLNVHPGLLPASRGLDTLKWSIVERKQVGVTAHLCDEQADLGWLICEAVVPVYQEDTFHALAMRQYEKEIAMFPSAIRLLGDKTKDVLTRIEARGGKPKKRMGPRREAELMFAFEEYKEQFCVRSA